MVALESTTRESQTTQNGVKMSDYTVSINKQELKGQNASAFLAVFTGKKIRFDAKGNEKIVTANREDRIEALAQIAKMPDFLSRLAKYADVPVYVYVEGETYAYNCTFGTLQNAMTHRLAMLELAEKASEQREQARQYYNAVQMIETGERGRKAQPVEVNAESFLSDLDAILAG